MADDELNSIWERYEELKEIGSGSYGRALLVRHRSTNRRAVVKQIRIQGMTSAEKEEVKTEARILAELDHPNIIKLVDDSFIEHGSLHIVTEYANSGDLFEAIAEKSKMCETFDEATVLNWFVQVAMAVKHIHDRNILHRDLKSQNVFLTSQGIVKLGDFGIARVLSTTTQFCNTMVGTPYNMSPELCEDKPYDRKSDIWSLGTLLYELLTLKHAFNGKSLPALILKIMRGRYPPVPVRYTKELRDLVQQMLSSSPSARPSVSQILKKPFIMECIRGILAPGGRQPASQIGSPSRPGSKIPSARAGPTVARPNSALAKPRAATPKHGVPARSAVSVGRSGQATPTARPAKTSRPKKPATSRIDTGLGRRPGAQTPSSTAGRKLPVAPPIAVKTVAAASAGTNPSDQVEVPREQGPSADHESENDSDDFNGDATLTFDPEATVVHLSPSRHLKKQKDIDDGNGVVETKAAGTVAISGEAGPAVSEHISETAKVTVAPTPTSNVKRKYGIDSGLGLDRERVKSTRDKKGVVAQSKNKGGLAGRGGPTAPSLVTTTDPSSSGVRTPAKNDGRLKTENEQRRQATERLNQIKQKRAALKSGRKDDGTLDVEIYTKDGVSVERISSPSKPKKQAPRLRTVSDEKIQAGEEQVRNEVESSLDKKKRSDEKKSPNLKAWIANEKRAMKEAATGSGAGADKSGDATSWNVEMMVSSRNKAQIAGAEADLAVSSSSQDVTPGHSPIPRDDEGDGGDHHEGSARNDAEFHEASKTLEHRIAQLRSHCIQNLGQRTFTEIYVYLSRKSTGNFEDEDDDDYLRDLLTGHEDWRDIGRSIAQLIYCEDALVASENEVLVTFV